MKKEGKRKALSALVCGSMLTVALVGGTLAYLTDEAGAQHNVFSVGDLNITLDEKVGVFGEGGEVKELEDGAEYTGIMPGDFLQKEVTVSNEGTTDAYVAVTVTLSNEDGDFALLLNKAIDEKYGDDNAQAIYDEIFVGWGLNHGKDLNGDDSNDAGMRLTITGEDMPEHVIQVDSVKTIDEYSLFYNGNWFGAESDVFPFDNYYTNDMDKYEFKYTYYALLPAEESTTLFEGLNVPDYFDADQLAMFDGLKIDVSASAIQADNIPVAAKYVGELNGEAKTAFELLAGQMAAPEGVSIDVVVSNNDELDAAIKAGNDALYLLEGNYIIPDSAQGKTLTIIGSGDTVIATQDDGSYEGCDYSLDGSTVTFENITINTDSATYTGYARLKATYNNCTINGTYTLYGESTFNNCAFNVSGDVYNIWTWGAPKATFVDCTFTSDGKAVLLYGTANTHLSIENCVFNDKGGLTDKKAAIEIGNDYGKSYELNVSNTVVNGYEINDKGINTGSTLWANKNSMGTDKLNVVVDGVDVY